MSYIIFEFWLNIMYDIFDIYKYYSISTKMEWIVFDIDGTLAVTINDNEYNSLKNTELKSQFINIKFKPTGCRDPHFKESAWVIKRPYINELLKYCFEHFKVGVWSTGQKDYVHQIVNILFPHQPHFIYTWHNCQRITKPKFSMLKPLTLSPIPNPSLGLIIDDKYDVIDANDNYIIAPEFIEFKYKSDKYLLKLLTWIKQKPKLPCHNPLI